MIIYSGSPRLQRKVRRRKVATVRDFPENCGPSSLIIAGHGNSSCAVMNRANSNEVPPLSNSSTTLSYKMGQIPKNGKNSRSNVRRPKVDVVRDFPENCGPFAPPENFNGVGEEIAADDEMISNCGSFEVKWKQDFERLSLVLAQVKEYYSLVAEYPSSKVAFALEDSKCVAEGKISTDPLKGRREREENLDVVMSDTIGGLLQNGRRMKVDDIINRVLEKNKPSQCVSKMENKGGEMNLSSSRYKRKSDREL